MGLLLFCFLLEYLIFSLQTIGSQVLVKVVKNKHAPPFRTAQFELEFGKGISRESEIIELGHKHKFITQNGSFYSLNDQNYHGKDAIKKHLAENPVVKEELIMKLREKLLDFSEENEKESETGDADKDFTDEIISPDTTDEYEITAVVA